MMEADDVYLAVMREAWADIRSFISNIWQVAAITVSVLLLIATILLSYDANGVLLFHSISEWILMTLSSGFAFFMLMSRYGLSTR